MTNEAAVAILQQLLEGVDPRTGEIFGDEHVCNDPQVIRALYRAVRALYYAKEYPKPVRENRKKAAAPPPSAQKPERAGKPWTDEECRRLEKLFKSRLSIEVMAAQLRRSSYAVYCKLEHMGLYADEPGYPKYDAMPMMTSDDIALLRQKFLEGTSLDELAAYFGRDKKSIAYRLFYMGLLKKSPAPRLHGE